MTSLPSLPAIGVRIAGTGMAVPPRQVTNDDLAQSIDTNDEWIRQRTGIVTRHLSDEATKTSDLAAKAVADAVADAGLKPTDLDLVICATMTPDMICPAAACRVVEKIGAVPCGAMDLNMACTGLLGAMAVAHNFIRAGAARHVAVVGAETLSRIVNWQDRRTCVLFGDGAGAMVLSASDDTRQGCLFQTLHSDASQSDALYIPRDASDFPAYVNPEDTSQPGWNGQFNTLQMQGQAVFKFAVNALRNCVELAMAKTGLTADDIAMVVPHQSNLRIMQTAWKKLGFSDEKIYVNIDRYGNTSAASMGLCFHELRAQGRIHPGQKVIFVAQGGGLTWGASLWQL